MRFNTPHYLFLACFALLVQAQLLGQTAEEKALQTQFVLAEDGDTITLPSGKMSLSNTLWLDDKSNVTIRGAGEGKTILTFEAQVQGAEGIKITNSKNIRLENFTIQDSKGDLIKTQHVDGLVFAHITAEWTGKPKSSNGAYALYPVQCSNILIEACTARGASDAGIYVGQSDQVEVRKCLAENNVAGIEIENTTNAVVHDNVATHNTGGILIFDLPDLPKKRGGHVVVNNNKVLHNNYKNFAPKGNIVGKVPPGTGIMVLATHDVTIRNNNVQHNRTASVVIASYYISENPINDKDYIPYPADIRVVDNLFHKGKKEKKRPTWRNKMGFLFWLKFGRNVPHVLWDGIENPEWVDAKTGFYDKEHRICIGPNRNNSFANLKADKKFKGISRSLDGHNCY